jgi:hypothetical protein
MEENKENDSSSDDATLLETNISIIPMMEDNRMGDRDTSLFNNTWTEGDSGSSMQVNTSGENSNQMDKPGNESQVLNMLQHMMQCINKQSEEMAKQSEVVAIQEGVHKLGNEIKKQYNEVNVKLGLLEKQIQTVKVDLEEQISTLGTSLTKHIINVEQGLQTQIGMVEEQVQKIEQKQGNAEMKNVAVSAKMDELTNLVTKLETNYDNHDEKETAIGSEKIGNVEEIKMSMKIKKWKTESELGETRGCGNLEKRRIEQLVLKNLLNRKNGKGSVRWKGKWDRKKGIIKPKEKFRDVRVKFKRKLERGTKGFEALSYKGGTNCKHDVAD